MKKTIPFLFIFILLGSTINAQKPLQKYVTGGTYYQSALKDSLGYIGLGLNTYTPLPLAKLHILFNPAISPNYYPALRVDAITGSGSYSYSVELCKYLGSKYYGIYQTGTNNAIRNYFKDPVIFNNFGINNQSLHYAYFFANSDYIDSVSFVMTNASNFNSHYLPLKIDTTGITVRSKLVTTFFQLLSNSGSGKVLISDGVGNGSWTDVSGLMDNKWLVSKKESQTIYLDTTYKSVGIGTDRAQGYQLAVNGKIICTELQVKLYDNWPDNVFSKEYKLPSLKSVNTYVNEKKHLPGVPSAQEVKDKGIAVGEMNAILLQKVEELFKYVISLQKEIDELKASKKDN